MSKKFEVQTNTISNGWVNCWHDNDEYLYFDTKEDAQIEIDEFIKTMEIGVAEGYLSTAHTHNNYRIVEVNI